jgi:hypothetical protein
MMMMMMMMMMINLHANVAVYAQAIIRLYMRIEGKIIQL